MNSWSLLRSFTARAAKDLLIKPGHLSDPETHLEEAVQWLKRAHDVSPNDGVSWGYSLKGGWRPSYRETSGYIAVTFFDWHQYAKDDSRERAIAIANWCVQMQNADGSISDPRYGSGGIVFDTGQVLLGLVRAFQETNDPKFLQAANRAGDWLVNVADAEGRWTKNTHNGIPHVYNTRVAWALLQLHQLHPTPDRERVARANLDWAVSQQQHGLFDQCAFTPGVAPFTHTIAYAIRGLLESGLLLNDQTYLNAANAGAIAMTSHVRADGFIPGQIDLNGKPHGRYCCLTGNCQMAIIWLKLFAQNQERWYYESAASSLRYVMACQDIRTSDPNIRGGIKGSHPIWGTYTRLSYPNWAAKFFVDALLLLVRTER
ncbi:hypothetical protein IQ268_21790 [Oculatella sp. LEGE 06141]|nr:hypothetical protein [Oculatella sp. LEGE 06141]